MKTTDYQGVKLALAKKDFAAAADLILESLNVELSQTELGEAYGNFLLLALNNLAVLNQRYLEELERLVARAKTADGI